MFAALRLEQVRLILLLILALGLRLGYCAVAGTLGRSPDPDYREYVIVAARLLEHGAIQSPMIRDDSAATPSYLLPPAYLGLVALVYRVFGVETTVATLVLQLLNALATSLAVLLTYWIARSIAGARTAWLAAGFVTINPTLIRYTDYIWDTSLFALGATLCTWIAGRMSRRPQSGARWAGFGLALGAVALLNPAFTLAYPLLVLWPVTQGQGWSLRPIVRAVGWSLFGWLLAIAPWTIRNAMLFDKLTYIRGGLMHEVWLGVCPEADVGNEAVFQRRYPLKSAEEQERVARLGEAAYLEDRGREGLRAWLADPKRAVRLSLSRAADFWTGNAFSSTFSPGERWPKSLATAAGMVFLTVESLVLLGGVLVVRRTGVQLRWVLAILFSFCLVYALTHVMVRFRAPIEPLVAVALATVIADAARSRSPGNHAEQESWK